MRLFFYPQLCGKTLEGEEKFSNVEDASQIDEEKSWSVHPSPKMDNLITLVTSLTTQPNLPDDLQKDLKAIIDTRTNDRWATAEAENTKAKEESAKSLAKATPRKSAAIKIEVTCNNHCMIIWLQSYQISAEK